MASSPPCRPPREHARPPLIKPVRLTERHSPALEELLLADPLINLFLLGYLDAVPIGRTHWYGVLDGDQLRAAIVVITGRLAVPWAPDPEHAEALGNVLRRRHRPTMMVGPREHTDIVWEQWGHDTPVDRWHDQRLYVCRAPQEGAPVPGFRRAVVQEWQRIAVHAAAMEAEDLGREPDPSAFEATIKRRIERGTTWVMEQDGELVFQINVGTSTAFGAQVGGTFVPPAHRGQGIATRGMRELGRRLLPRQRTLTLHVNEANLPAVRAYERSGYRAYAPYRLLTLREHD